MAKSSIVNRRFYFLFLSFFFCSSIHDDNRLMSFQFARGGRGGFHRLWVADQDRQPHILGYYHLVEAFPMLVNPPLPFPRYQDSKAPHLHPVLGFFPPNIEGYLLDAHAHLPDIERIFFSPRLVIIILDGVQIAERMMQNHFRAAIVIIMLIFGVWGKSRINT